MKPYSYRFHNILSATIKGFVIGGIASAIIAYLIMLKNFKLGDYLIIVVSFTLVIGPICSIFVSAKDKTKENLQTKSVKMFYDLKNTFFGITFGFNALFALSLIKFVVGVILMVPLFVYMAFSYTCNFVYWGIMCVLEKANKLEGKSDLCRTLDKCVEATPLFVTAIVCVMVVKAIMA